MGKTIPKKKKSAFVQRTNRPNLKGFFVLRAYFGRITGLDFHTEVLSEFERADRTICRPKTSNSKNPVKISLFVNCLALIYIYLRSHLILIINEGCTLFCEQRRQSYQQIICHTKAKLEPGKAENPSFWTTHFEQKQGKHCTIRTQVALDI